MSGKTAQRRIAPKKIKGKSFKILRGNIGEAVRTKPLKAAVTGINKRPVAGNSTATRNAAAPRVIAIVDNYNSGRWRPVNIKMSLLRLRPAQSMPALSAFSYISPGNI